MKKKDDKKNDKKEEEKWRCIINVSSQKGESLRKERFTSLIICSVIGGARKEKLKRLVRSLNLSWSRKRWYLKKISFEEI
jgi:hypothetical protein